MKNNKIYISGLIIIVAAAAIMTLAQTSYAATSTNKGANNATSTTNLLKHKKIGSWLKKGTKPNPTAQADRLKKQAAIDAALQASDYNAWVQAIGTTSPILTQINQNNFPKFVQAYQLKKQADAIMTELGVNVGEGGGMMGGLHLNNSVIK